jgi:uncharacterized coiled-coil protein SlyX
MEWVNAVVVIAVLLMALHQKKRIKALEKTLAVQKEQLAAQAETLAAHKEILASQKAVLASYRELAGGTKPPVSFDVEGEEVQEVKTSEDVRLRMRQEMAEEKSRFEKEVQEKKKTMDWYEKEFAIGLDTVLELYLHLPFRVRESIIGKMPNSVIKKGFKRLSKARYEA